MGVSLKKDLHFLHGAHDATFPWFEHWMHTHAPPNPPLMK